MDNSLKYSEILKKTVQEAASEQPSRVSSVNYRIESG